MKRTIRKFFIYLLLLLLLATGIFLWKAFPILCGYNAKVLCSDIFVQGRSEEDVETDDLGSFPWNIPKCNVDWKDSSVTCSVWGMAKKKAVYRKGIGAVLLNGISEADWRKRSIVLAVPPINQQDSMDWPMGNRIPATKDTGYDLQRLNQAIKYAFESQTGTRAVVVVHKGQLVAERYANGFTSSTRLPGWSMTKSIVNALIGILVKEGKINIKQSAILAQWEKDDRKKITIEDLMHMSSGLNWWEFYAAPSDCTNMLFNAKSAGEFAIHSSLAQAPGTVFNYSSGSTNLLSYIIRLALGDSLYYRFPYERLFYKTGMYSAVLEQDAGGTFIGSSYCYATARDWARFGLLYLNDGIMKGERVLPEGWVNFTRTPTKARDEQNRGYGALWWLNKRNGTNEGMVHPDVPEDAFACQGYEGQYVWVVPSEDLVIVRMALEKKHKLDPNVFLPQVIHAFH